MRRVLIVVFVLLALISVSLVLGEDGDVRDPFFKPGTIKALILSGRNNHDWRATTPALKGILEKSGRFDVRIEEEPAGITSLTLAPYDVIILDYQGPRWGEVTETAVTDFVMSGKGLVIYHGASYGFSGLDVLGDRHVRTGITEPGWPEFIKLSGGVWSEENPKTAHGDRHSFKVVFVEKEHPITGGLGDSFLATDELYHDLRMDPAVKVLANAYSDPATRGTGEDEPILWTMEPGKGRTFHNALGHDLNALNARGFAVTFARGCEWAATGKVTIPPTFDPLRPADADVRALVVTGGHDYDTDFYTLFEGDWVTWDHKPTNTEAFENPIRDRYDVVVMYDMSRNLGVEGRKHLREFVESGKGVVVLHHALANYNAWEWWWHDVVGARYILEGGPEPASDYKHDVDLYATAVGRHPVTADVAPMQIIDETYKNMWISPEVKVILETDEESSDGPLAWISPYEKSRVIAIQLGHDRHAHRYPGFRKLVKRAILWSAGKLE